MVTRHPSTGLFGLPASGFGRSLPSFFEVSHFSVPTLSVVPGRVAHTTAASFGAIIAFLLFIYVRVVLVC